MPETGLSGSEGGGAFNPLSLPLSEAGSVAVVLGIVRARTSFPFDRREGPLRWFRPEGFGASSVGAPCL